MRFSKLNVDHAEFACFKAILLFEPGIHIIEMQLSAICISNNPETINLPGVVWTRPIGTMSSFQCNSKAEIVQEGAAATLQSHCAARPGRLAKLLPLLPAVAALAAEPALRRMLTDVAKHLPLTHPYLLTDLPTH